MICRWCFVILQRWSSIYSFDAWWFKNILETSSLQVNVDKSAFYFSDMSEYDVNRVQHLSGYTRGKFPFRYLGIPICAKSISNAECEAIVEKMVARVKAWSSRHLSFKGRVQLANSVLLSIHIYWAQVMILPNSLLKWITSICRSFLWYGTHEKLAPRSVAWGSVCKLKKADGLGLRQIKLWNVAAIGKLTWAIASKKDCLWVKWVNSVYIKDSQWWAYIAPVDGNWYWKQIFYVTNVMAQFYSSNALSSLPSYSIKDTYQKMLLVQQRVPWDNNVWCRLVMPKQKFISWISMLNILKTRDQLLRNGVCVEKECSLCADADESHEHLLFSCNYSMKCWLAIKSWCSIGARSNNIKSIARWINRCRASKLKMAVFSAVLCARIYFLWGERNYSMWNQQLLHTSKTCYSD